MKPYSNSTKLDKLVKVVQLSGQKDDKGNPLYEDFFTAYAQVADRAGAETLDNSQNKRVSTAKTTFTFRATEQATQILPTMLVIWRGFEHEILTPTIFSDDRLFVSVETIRKY